MVKCTFTVILVAFKGMTTSIGRSPLAGRVTFFPGSPQVPENCSLSQNFWSSTDISQVTVVYTETVMFFSVGGLLSGVVTCICEVTMKKSVEMVSKVIHLVYACLCFSCEVQWKFVLEVNEILTRHMKCFLLKERWNQT